MREMSPTRRVVSPGRLVAALLSALVVLYAAALRVEALTMRYGPVERPAWLQSLQTDISSNVRPLRPAGFVWEAEDLYSHRDGPPTRYISDPYTYLGFARQMQSFYAAHYREPLFVASTRVWLWLLDDQDVAVSFASMTFSLAAVVIAIALGWYAFSPWVGVGAGALMAIEYELILWGVRGWRDEAFLAIVPLWALAMLRAARAPAIASGAALGAAGGLALLVRITSLSFVVPGLAYLILAGTKTWRDRVRAAAAAGLVAAIIAGPYFFNCWREFGDPLYAITHHTAYYERTETGPAPASSVSRFVTSAALARPFGTIDTVAMGLTAYPFANKWKGFDAWLPGLGAALSWAALAGLLAFAGSPTGRLLLVVLATSLVPFSLTWRLLPDWRFTEHTYPFFLLAACAAAGQAVAAARWIRRRSAEGRGLRPTVAVWAVVGVALGAAWWAGTRVLPVLAAEEALALGDGVAIEAGRRDHSFFGSGWSAPARQGAITMRTSDGFPSTIWLPLRRPGDFDLRLRVDPFPPPAASGATGSTLLVFANGRPIGRVALVWDPERVGWYELRLPREATRAGFNRIELALDAGVSPVASGGADSPPAFRLWYLLVRPAPPN
jgi:hypothetical protein